MKTLLLLMFSPKKGVLNFQNRFRDNLYTEGMYLAFLYSIIYSISFFSITSIYDKFFTLFMTILFICIWLLLFMVLSFVINQLSLLMKGNANYKETFALLMYAYFPIFIFVLILLLLKHPNLDDIEFNTNIFRFLILFLSWLISLKILLVGFKEIYNLSFKKTIITLLPIFLLFLGRLALSFYLIQMNF